MLLGQEQGHSELSLDPSSITITPKVPIPSTGNELLDQAVNNVLHHPQDHLSQVNVGHNNAVTPDTSTINEDPEELNNRPPHLPETFDDLKPIEPYPSDTGETSDASNVHHAAQQDEVGKGETFTEPTSEQLHHYAAPEGASHGEYEQQQATPLDQSQQTAPLEQQTQGQEHLQHQQQAATLPEDNTVQLVHNLLHQEPAVDELSHDTPQQVAAQHHNAYPTHPPPAPPVDQSQLHHLHQQQQYHQQQQQAEQPGTVISHQPLPSAESQAEAHGEGLIDMSQLPPDVGEFFTPNGHIDTTVNKLPGSTSPQEPQNGGQEGAFTFPFTLSNDDIQSIKNSYGAPLPQEVSDFFDLYASKNYHPLTANIAQLLPQWQQFAAQTHNPTLQEAMESFFNKKSNAHISKNSSSEGKASSKPVFNPPIKVTKPPKSGSTGKQPIKLKLNLKPKEDGHFEMKIKGPFDQFGKKLPSESSSKDTKDDASYEQLSSADRVKLLEQNYRELKMEEARAKYPLKFLPPINRNYIDAPTSESLQSKERPRVRVKIPKVANKSLIVSNYIPSWGGSPNSKLNIRLPIDVSLAAVLKNIYEHMYQYYIHEDPKKGITKSGVPVRQVIQGLVDKDMKNISKIVHSRNISPYDSSPGPFDGPPTNDKRIKQALNRPSEITKTFFKKNVEKVLPFKPIISQPKLLPQIPAKRILQPPPLPLPQLVVPNLYRGKLDPLDDRFQLMRVLNSFARLPPQFIDLLDTKHHFPPFDALLLKYKNRLNLPDTEMNTAKKSLNGKPQYPPVIQEKVSFLSSIEPYLRVLSYLKMRDMRVLRTEFAKTMMSIPLTAIQKDEKRRQLALAAKRRIKRPTLPKKGLVKTPNKVQVGDRRQLPLRRTPKKEPEKPKESPAEDISSTNYFLIDTTGVADNKPMVIESVEDYLRKLHENNAKKSNLAATKNTVQKPASSLPPANAHRNSFAPAPQSFKKYNWDKRHHVFNPYTYHTLVARDNIPNVGGKFFSNEEILLQRHHKLYKTLKLMKRFAPLPKSHPLFKTLKLMKRFVNESDTLKLMKRFSPLPKSHHLFKTLKLMKRFVNESDSPEKSEDSDKDDGSSPIKLKSTNSSDCQLNDKYDMCINETLPNNTRLINAIRSALLSLTTRNLNNSLESDNENNEDDSELNTKQNGTNKKIKSKNQRSKDVSKKLKNSSSLSEASDMDSKILKIKKLKNISNDKTILSEASDIDSKITKKKVKKHVKNYSIKTASDIDIMDITINGSSNTSNFDANTNVTENSDSSINRALVAEIEQESNDAPSFNEKQALKKIKMKDIKEEQNNITHEFSKKLSSNITKFFDKNHTKSLTKDLSVELSKNMSGDVNRNDTKDLKNRTEEITNDLTKDLTKVLLPDVIDTNDTDSKTEKESQKVEKKLNANKDNETKSDEDSKEQSGNILEKVLDNPNVDNNKNNHSKKLGKKENKNLSKNSTQNQEKDVSTDLMANLTKDITEDLLKDNPKDSSKNNSSKDNKDQSKKLSKDSSKSKTNNDKNKASSDNLIKNLTLGLDDDFSKGIDYNTVSDKNSTKNNGNDGNVASKNRKKDLNKDFKKDDSKKGHLSNATKVDQSEDLPTDSAMESAEPVTEEPKDFNYNEISINKDLSENISEDIMKGFDENHKSEDFNDSPVKLSKKIATDVSKLNKKNATSGIAKNITSNGKLRKTSKNHKPESPIDSKNSTNDEKPLLKEIVKDINMNASTNLTTNVNKELPKIKLEFDGKNSSKSYKDSNKTRYDSKKVTDNIIDSIGHNLKKAKKILRNATEAHTTYTIANHLKSIQSVIEATKNKSKHNLGSRNTTKSKYSQNENMLNNTDSSRKTKAAKYTHHVDKDLMKSKVKSDEKATMTDIPESITIQKNENTHKIKKKKQKQKSTSSKKDKEKKKEKAKHEEKKHKKKNKSNNDQLKFQNDLPDDKNELNQGMFNDNDMGTYHNQNEKVFDSLTKSLEIDQVKANNLTNLHME